MRPRGLLFSRLTGGEHLFILIIMPYKDVERQRAYGREWMKRNPEKARAAMQRWRIRHPDAHRAELRDHYRRSQVRRERIIAWLRAHPEVRTTTRERRRARVAGAQGSYTSAEWRELLRQYGGRCAYCGAVRPLEVEHRTPLLRGGSNLITNIAPACRLCNSRKHTLTEEEFWVRIQAVPIQWGSTAG